MYFISTSNVLWTGTVRGLDASTVPTILSEWETEMPFPDGPEGGIRNPFSNRVGIDQPRFRGVNLQSDAGSIGDDQFIKLDNTRLDGTGVKCRPGLSAINTNAMSACLWGIFDDRCPDDDGNAIFNAVRNGYSPETWTGFGDPTSGSAPWNQANVAGKLNGQTIIIDSSGVGYSFSYVTTDGVPEFTTTPVFTYTSILVNPRVHSVVEFDGALWFSLHEEFGTIQIWRWTGGATATLMKSVAPAAADTGYGTLGTDGSDLYFAYQGFILKYDDGTWTSLTLPAGPTIWTPVGYFGLARPPYLYFSGFDVGEPNVTQTLVILQVLGTTVTVANDDIPTYSGASNSYGALTELNGYLYAVGNTTQGVDNYSLYQISGADAASAVADLTAQFGAQATNDDGVLLQMLQWRGQLFMSVPTGVTTAAFVKADLNNPLVWTIVTTDQNVLADGTSNSGVGNLFTA